MSSSLKVFLGAEGSVVGALGIVDSVVSIWGGEGAKAGGRGEGAVSLVTGLSGMSNVGAVGKQRVGGRVRGGSGVFLGVVCFLFIFFFREVATIVGEICPLSSSDSGFSGIVETRWSRLGAGVSPLWASSGRLRARRADGFGSNSIVIGGAGIGGRVVAGLYRVGLFALFRSCLLDRAFGPDYVRAILKFGDLGYVSEVPLAPLLGQGCSSVGFAYV